MRADVALLIEPEPEPESLEVLSAATSDGSTAGAGVDSPMTTLREVCAPLFVPLSLCLSHCANVRS